MKENPVRLGVLSLLLLVISICLTVMGVLSFSTAQADMRLSRRYAETTSRRYEAEALGQEFLSEAQDALDKGISLDSLEGVTEDGGIYVKEITAGASTLRVGIKAADGKIETVCWKTVTGWSPEENFGGLWEG